MRMITTKVNSILPVFDLDLEQVAVSVRGSFDPPFLPKVEVAPWTIFHPICCRLASALDSFC